LRAETTTSDTSSHRGFWKFIEAELDKIDFMNKFVLDAGCRDGYCAVALHEYRPPMMLVRIGPATPDYIWPKNC
jgi:hypothetical protein